MPEEPSVLVNPSEADLNNGDICLDDPPLVSFCIPTYNNRKTIKSCLQSIKGQKYPSLEIVIVDGGSTDGTVELASQFTDKIHLDDGPLGSARQTSLEKANGKIIGLFDSDIVLPHVDWLKNAVKRFNYSEDVSTVWPENVAPPGTSPTTQLYFKLWHVIEEDRMKTGRGPLGGGNSLFRRDYLEEIGGVDKSIHFGEDLAWATELSNQGYKVVYHKDPIYHYTMLSFGEFTRKQFGYAVLSQIGSDITGLSTRELIYEQLVVGTKGMVRGLTLDQEWVWLMYPLFVLVRGLAFLTTVVKGSPYFPNDDTDNEK